MTEETDLQQFLDFSAHLTGYDPFRLRGTGQSECYLSTVIDVVGERTARELLQTYDRIRKESGDDDAAMDNLLRAAILSDDRLGPIARNIIKLWFVGTWYQLPPAWRAAFGALESDTTFVASPNAYPEGLLWPTVGANPPGAKGPGYGSWTGPPRIDVRDRSTDAENASLERFRVSSASGVRIAVDDSDGVGRLGFANTG